MARKDRLTGTKARLTAEEKRALIKLWYRNELKGEELPKDIDIISGVRLRDLFDSCEEAVNAKRKSS